MSWEPVWEEVFSKKEWGKYPAEDLIRFVARNFYRAPNRADIKILEVGSGTGTNLCYMAGEGFTVYGIDGSAKGVSIAQTRLKNDPAIDEQRTHVIEGDMISLPYETEFFDAVIDIESIYTNRWENTVHILQEIHRVLKPNGKFYSKHFAEHTEGDGTGEYVDRHMYIPDSGALIDIGPVRFATEADIHELYEDKFVITELEQAIRTTNNRTCTIIEWLISMDRKDCP
ncbi:class I SAM-dependent methyltransferase [Paenibacillus campi]|uniref:class I SAM-dependent methyltransferase n=1 Tax=Paenibacillus campi TaxID=3106031 RepID=UPI002B003C06|nr:class I SAM-dependent methyltransferase [Paenibacillus sp. SGZ-1014]